MPGNFGNKSPERSNPPEVKKPFEGELVRDKVLAVAKELAKENPQGEFTAPQVIAKLPLPPRGTVTHFYRAINDLEIKKLIECVRVERTVMDPAVSSKTMKTRIFKLVPGADSAPNPQKPDSRKRKIP